MLAVCSVATCASMMCWAIRYHLYNLKNVKNTHGGVLLYLKLQAKAFIFTKTGTPPRMFLRFLNCTNDTELRKASQIFTFSNCAEFWPIVFSAVVSRFYRTKFKTETEIYSAPD